MLVYIIYVICNLPIMGGRWPTTSLHTARWFLWFTRQLQSWRWRWRRRAGQPPRCRSTDVLHISRRRRRTTELFAARGSATLAQSPWSWSRRRRPAGQPAVDGRRRTHRRRRPRHVALDGHVSGRRHVPRTAGALRFRTAANPPRWRRKPIRQRRGRRRAEPLRRRSHAERARRREALARWARILLAHSARSGGPAAARAPFHERRHTRSHAALSL